MGHSSADLKNYDSFHFQMFRLLSFTAIKIMHNNFLYVLLDGVRTDLKVQRKV